MGRLREFLSENGLADNTILVYLTDNGTASGAKVFSTGSIQWMWGLDSTGVIGARVDQRAQQMTVNVLSDMGAKPFTPDPGLIIP